MDDKSCVYVLKIARNRRGNKLDIAVATKYGGGKIDKHGTITSTSQRKMSRSAVMALLDEIENGSKRDNRAVGR